MTAEDDKLGQTPASTHLSQPTGTGNAPVGDRTPNDKPPGTGTGQRSDPKRSIERIIDSIKRLFAVIIALSFQQAAGGVYESFNLAFRITNAEIDQNTILTLTIELFCFFAFIATLFVYYYQSDRYFDIAFAEKESSNRHWLSLPKEFILKTLTMIPFLFIAKSLNPTIDKSSARFQFGWFMIACLFLLLWSCMIIAIDFLIMLLSKRNEITNEEHAAHAPSAFWMILDLTYCIIAMILLSYFGSKDPCIYSNASVVLIFSGCFIARSAFDIWVCWNLTFPSAKPSESKIKEIYMSMAGSCQLILCWLVLILTSGVLAWKFYQFMSHERNNLNICAQKIELMEKPKSGPNSDL